MARPLVNPLFFGPLSRTVHNHDVSASIDQTVYYGTTLPDRSVANGDIQNTDTRLIQLFAEAQSAFRTSDQPKVTLDWQPTVRPIPNCTSTGNRKRDAATAGLSTHADSEIGAKAAKTTPHSTVKRPRGRPRGTSKKPLQESKPTTLSSSNPIQQKLPPDIWDQIVRFSDLHLAISISRVSHVHQDLLLKSSLWKVARHHVYGSDHPDPPPCMTERQYAELLVGSGCQDKGCRNHRAKDTCWAVQRRWCVACLKKKTISVDSCDFFMKRYPEIARFVTRIDLGSFTILKDSRQDNSAAIGFLRKDLARAADELDQAEREFGCSIEDRASNASFQAWLDNKATTQRVLLEKLQAIESWGALNRAKAREEAALKKQTKSAFFAAKALSMDPHLDLAALMQLECFRHAIVSKAKPSERAWRCLKEKIRSEQAQQQQSIAAQTPEYVFYDLEWNEEEDFLPGTDLDFQSTIMMRADDRIDEVFDHGEPMQHGDFVRFFLDMIYKENEKSEYDDEYEYPQLTMEIARAIYEEHLTDEKLDDFVGENKLLGAARLTCPACKDDNAPEPKEFIGLMNHVWDCHFEPGPGCDAPFFKSTKEKYTTFPWNRFKWPETLPILPVGQMAPECKIRLTRSMDGRSAFDGRAAAPRVGQIQPDFAEDVLFAASSLEETSLEDKYRTQIALEYACQRWSRRSPPSRIQFEQLQMTLVRKGICGVFEGFRCQKCCEAARDGGTVGYFARSVKPLAKLSEHYFSKHNPATWSREMLNLPTPQELLIQLRLPCNENANAIFQRLFPIKKDAALDPRLQGDLHKGSSEVEEEAEEEEQGSEDDEEEGE
ncbi:MAG: hypothetical protein L6R41_000016 [Letrouitia leprolyta]|nr:MAG: hypothetical protein L6R41_000016 [Letrouitia leprolyta]